VCESGASSLCVHDCPPLSMRSTKTISIERKNCNYFTDMLHKLGSILLSAIYKYKSEFCKLIQNKIGSANLKFAKCHICGRSAKCHICGRSANLTNYLRTANVSFYWNSFFNTVFHPRMTKRDFDAFAPFRISSILLCVFAGKMQLQYTVQCT
jgi:hypothetical protein